MQGDVRDMTKLLNVSRNCQLSSKTETTSIRLKAKFDISAHHNLNKEYPRTCTYEFFFFYISQVLAEYGFHIRALLFKLGKRGTLKSLGGG